VLNDRTNEKASLVSSRLVSPVEEKESVSFGNDI
jgi:hypothetical protein